MHLICKIARDFYTDPLLAVTATSDDASPLYGAPLKAALDLDACPVPAWLPDRQSQTLFGALAVTFNRIRFVRELLNTPDGDFIDLDWNTPALQLRSKRKQDPALAHTAAVRWMTPVDQEQLNSGAAHPALVLLHGLEGSSQSRYAQSITQHFLA